MPQCTAKAKSTGKRCTRMAWTGTNVCGVHGAKAALANRGENHPNFKHGRRSKYFSPELAKRHEEHMNDPELLAYRNEIALLDVLLDDAIASIGIDAGAAARLWKQAAGYMVDFEIAMQSRNREKQQEAFIRLRNTVREGQQDAEARLEARKLVQERTTIAEKEIGRLTKMEHMMTAEQAYVLFKTIMDEAGRIITDTDTRARFNSAMARIAGSLSQ